MVNNGNIIVNNGNIMLNNWNIVVHNGSVSNFPQWGIPKLKWLVYNRKSHQNGWFGGIPVSGNHHMYIYAYMCVEMQANMYMEIYSCVKVVNKGEVYQSFAQFQEPVGKSLRMIIPQNPQNNSELYDNLKSSTGVFSLITLDVWGTHSFQNPRWDVQRSQDRANAFGTSTVDTSNPKVSQNNSCPIHEILNQENLLIPEHSSTRFTWGKLRSEIVLYLSPSPFKIDCLNVTIELRGPHLI